MKPDFIQAVAPSDCLIVIRLVGDGWLFSLTLRFYLRCIDRPFLFAGAHRQQLFMARWERAAAYELEAFCEQPVAYNFLGVAPAETHKVFALDALLKKRHLAVNEFWTALHFFVRLFWGSTTDWQ